jgi:hypothetical protein
VYSGSLRARECFRDGRSSDFEATGRVVEALLTQALSASSFIAVLWRDERAPEAASPTLRDLPGWRATRYRSREGRLELAFTTPSAGPTLDPVIPAKRLILLLGDDAEWPQTLGKTSTGFGVSLEIDFIRGGVRVLTSVVGLPPIYLYRGPNFVALTSEIHLLRALPACQPAIDPEGLIDLFRIGHPVAHRTLFQNVSLLPGGHRIEIDVGGAYRAKAVWGLPEIEPSPDWPSYLDHQVALFKRAVRQLKLGDAILSLTGGLDTRAILAVLVETGILVSAITISGRSLSLDARLARALAAAYGFPHTIVSLDDRFLRDLPTYVVEASRLSGGLMSVTGAHEVHFFRELQSRGSRRVSGLLGNQVGRRGFERLSLRNADIGILQPEVARHAATAQPAHWLEMTTDLETRERYQSFLQHETLFSSVAAYSIGHHFAIQQSPYANRDLIESSSRVPAGGPNGCFSGLQARLTDLHHRFFGTPREFSFQRQLIAGVGGFVARCPINWGWLAGGGVSLTGMATGSVAFLDMLSTRPNPLARALGHSLHLVRCSGLHEITQCRVWLRATLGGFVRDTLGAKDVRESGLFEPARLDALVHEYYSGREASYETVLAAVDVASALRMFQG